MFYSFLISQTMYIIYLFTITSKSLHMLQQNRYNRGYKYIHWLKKNIKKTFLNWTLLNLITLLIPILNNQQSMVYVFSLIYFTLTLILINRKEQEKIPLVYTPRIKRLFLTESIIMLIIYIIIGYIFKDPHLSYYYITLGLIAYLNPLTILIFNFLNRPLEYTINHHYQTKAKKKLTSLPSLEVIGITGSYGKTSSKNILNDILSTKYSTLQTPKNYNTPHGLTITINEHLDKFTDYLIAEMGACRPKEIKELCNIVSPKYGIITKIGLAHLETFGTPKNIQKTKFELIESLPPDGLGILNADDEQQTSYQIKNNVPITWIGIDNKKADYVASNIEMSHTGMTFQVKIKGEKKKYTFKTKLLGTSNIYNILAGIALGHHLGLTPEELIKSINRLKPLEHRLDIKKYHDIFLIDDAYNANPTGADMALEVLNLMPGKKVIVTPGMIELGKSDYEIHYKFGQNIAKVADEVILIGKQKTKPILEGLQSTNYPQNKIHILSNIMDAFPLLIRLKPKKQNLYALLENDLPDIFNERK